MNTPQAPAAPDPVATANAQSAANKETAIAQANLNNYDQVDTYGSRRYTQIGTNADGTPKFQLTTELSPEQQGLYNKSLTTQNNLADIGNTQSAKIGALLNSPFSVDTAIADNLTALGRQRLDPQFARDQASLETQLINKGVRPGSEAYNEAMAQFGRTKNDAYNSLYLNGQQSALQQSLAERNQPINEISALLSQSQVSNPTANSTPTTGIAPTDYIGAQQQSLNQQNVGYQAQVANNNALMSGLFGLGKTALGGWAGNWGK